MQRSQLTNLLSSMTLEEKVAQLVQLTGDFYSDKADDRTGPMAQLGVSDEELRNVGTILGVSGAGECRRIQRDYMERNRLHIPTMFMADVIHGYRTIFPIPLALGSSWNPESVERAAEISAREASVAGLSLTFSPMVDLVRDPRWGRVMESTGEDPYLNAMMARAFVHGYQGEDLSNDRHRVAACVKHFAAYGAPVGGREYNTVNMSERQLRDMYLPGYRAAVDAGAATVMTAFNTVDGIPATGNRHLFRDILRNEWGFDGVVISDFNAVKELENHGVAADDREAAELAIRAGVDIEMMSICYMRALPNLVRSGEIDEALIDQAAMRILTLKNDLGLFEHPLRGADEDEERRVIMCDAHRQAARTIGSQSIVLLANHDDILPLRRTTTVALVGPGALSHDVLGSWSAEGVQREAVTLADGLRLGAQSHEINLLLPEREPAAGGPVGAVGGVGDDKGGLASGDASEFVRGEAGKLTREYAGEYVFPDKTDGFADDDAGVVEHQSRLRRNLSYRSALLACAARADAVVMALGEPSWMSGEAASRTDIRLPKEQIDLFNAVYEVNPHIVVVLTNGRPLDLGAIDRAQAIVETWFLGTESGAAIADVLYGDVNPSGRLSMSFPENVGQVPVYYNSDSTGRPSTLAPHEKYVSRYLDATNEPRYPFGYGLSYSQFSYGAPVMSSLAFDTNHPLHIDVDITNTSSTDGIEVAQLYVRDLVAQVVRPMRELKEFQRLSIPAHSTRTAHFTLAESDVRYVHPNLQEYSDPGAFDVWIGANSRDVGAAIRVELR